MTNDSAIETFEWPVRVYYEDTDAQGVVYYANYFRFMERARTEWLRALGVDQQRMHEQDRKIFVVVSTRAEFIVPAQYNRQGTITRNSVTSEATLNAMFMMGFLSRYRPVFA